MDVDLDADVNSNDVTVIETGTYEDVEVDAKENYDADVNVDAKADLDSEIDMEENVEVDVVQMWMQK